MGAQNFDIDFEDYIIFHRGVQEVSFDPNDNHLRVTYQDGYVQDLGDPLGDRVARAEEAGAYAAQVETTLRAKEAEISQQLNQAISLSGDAVTKYERTIEIGDEVQEAKAYVDGQIEEMFEGSIDGIEKNDETGKYYVDLSDYSTTTSVETLIDNGILKINGIKDYSDMQGNRKYYLDPMEEGSKTTEAVNDMIDERLENVHGIAWDQNINKYTVDISEDAITKAEIDELFA